LYIEKGEYGVAEGFFKKSVEVNRDNQRLRAESMAGLAISLQSKAYKASSLQLDHRLNDMAYLTGKLNWSDGLIGLWIAVGD